MYFKTNKYPFAVFDSIVLVNCSLQEFLLMYSSLWVLTQQKKQLFSYLFSNCTVMNFNN